MIYSQYLTYFCRAGKVFVVDLHCLCNTINVTVAKQKRTKREAYGTLREKMCSILIADEKLESRLKIKEHNISLKIRVLPDSIWTDVGKIREYFTVCTYRYGHSNFLHIKNIVYIKI